MNNVEKCGYSVRWFCCYFECFNFSSTYELQKMINKDFEKP